MTGRLVDGCWRQFGRRVRWEDYITLRPALTPASVNNYYDYHVTSSSLEAVEYIKDFFMSNSKCA